ncbi:V-Type Proton Atpase Subunit S1 [Manis pentadactyla]|nr:V-Type Proton Atpase Subunit S1 [Manis pentadactyla]
MALPDRETQKGSPTRPGPPVPPRSIKRPLRDNSRPEAHGPGRLALAAVQRANPGVRDGVCEISSSLSKKGAPVLIALGLPDWAENQPG